MEESKRIRKLKEKMINELPFFPNERTTLNELENQSLSGVLIAYLHWKTRLVPSRKRRIIISPEITSDKRWKVLKPNIEGLLDKVRNGEDLSPHLSSKAHKYGYTPIENIRNGDIDSWEDKDQILNTKGFHHFHLNMVIQHTGLAERTDDVLFAFVLRDQFHAVGIFDHSVFKKSGNESGMTAERERMWGLHKKYTTLGMAPGTFYISNPITTSGHPLGLIRFCDYYANLIRERDNKLDDRVFINSLYGKVNLPPPKKYNFEWVIDGLDLILFDKRNNVRFVVNEANI